MKYNYTTSLKKPLKSKKNRLKTHFIGGVIRSFSKTTIFTLFITLKTVFYYPHRKKLNFFPTKT